MEWIAKSDEKSDSILEMSNRFRAAGIEELEIIYINLYPNRCGLVNQIENLSGLRLEEFDLGSKLMICSKIRS